MLHQADTHARYLVTEYKKGNRVFCGAHFVGTDFWSTGVLERENGQISLQSADFRQTDFSRSWLSTVDFRFSNFEGADFGFSHLSSVYFRGANLSHVNFRGAVMGRADFRGANLKGANLSCTNLAYIKVDHKTCLSGTVLDPKAVPAAIPDEVLAWEGLQVDGEFVIGWRTDSSLYMQGQSHVIYEEGRIYTAPIFSVCTETTCHPGIYLRGNRSENLAVALQVEPLRAIRVCCLRRELVWAKEFKRQFRAKRVLVLPS